MPSHAVPDPLTTVRRLVLGVVVLGFVGTGAELLLIGHDEDVWQLIPLVMLGAGLAVALPAAIRERPGRSLVRAFRAVMLLLIVSGALGTVLHYRANMEFKLESDPAAAGLPLFWSVMQAKAPPALAPGTLVLFGLLGLAVFVRAGATTSGTS